MVIASTLVTILIVIGVVVAIVAVFLAFGPLRSGESIQDDVEADEFIRHGHELSPETEDEAFRDTHPTVVDDEARLDRENE
jgi:hypothetical protein